MKLLEQPVCPFMGHVAFAFDGYKDIEFNMSKQFVITMVKNFHPAAHSVLASVLYFGDSTIINDKSDEKDKTYVVDKISRIVQSKEGKYDLVKGLHYALKNMFLTNHNKLIPQVLVLVTTAFDDKTDTEEKARTIKDIGVQLKAKGVQVIVVAQSTNEGIHILHNIHESRDQVILFKSIERLDEVNFIEKICKSVQKVRYFPFLFFLNAWKSPPPII